VGWIFEASPCIAVDFERNLCCDVFGGDSIDAVDLPVVGSSESRR